MSVIFEEYLELKLPFAECLNSYVKLKDVKTLFEVGACEGEDTVKLSREFKNAQIFSFEPLPKNIERLNSHIKKYNAERVTVYTYALSNKNGTAEFYVSSGTPEEARHDDPDWDYGNKSSSLLKPNKVSGHYEWLDFKEKISVSTLRLADFCEKHEVDEIDFMHMDVQGAELMVLEGAGDMLQNVKSIWLEVETVELYKGQPLEEQVETFMREHGFTCVLSTLSKVTGDKLYINNRVLESKWLAMYPGRKKPTLANTAQSLLAGTPRVSVLMSVYNSQSYLREAMGSILSQSFSDFEFLIINDGSKDKSLQIIKSYKDPRIRLIDRDNWGLTASLNQGIQLARGQYIARQDSDDVSVPERFEKEVAFLDSHPKVGMVGSNYTITNLKGKPIVTTNVFTHPDDLKLTQITCNQFGHGSVMMRKSVLDKIGGYDPTVGYVEDYDLWTRISRVADIANFEEPLYLYKSNDQGVSLQNQELQIKQTFAVRDKAFEHFMKYRRQYRLISYHPSGKNYKDRKATLYRDLAYLYRHRNKRFHAACMLVLSIIFQPKNKRNYRLLAKTLLKPNAPQWEYEFL